MSTTGTDKADHRRRTRLKQMRLDADQAEVPQRRYLFGNRAINFRGAVGTVSSRISQPHATVRLSVVAA